MSVVTHVVSAKSATPIAVVWLGYVRSLLAARKSLKLLLAVAALVAAAVFGVTEMTYRESTASLASLSSRALARTATATVLRRLLDAETAHRGYLLTGRAEYLAPGHDAALDIANALDQLERHYHDNARLLAVVKAIRARVEERRSELEATIAMYDAGQHERWRDLMSTNIGSEKMDAVRNSTEILMAHEDEQLRLERAGVVQTLGFSRAGLHLLTAVSLLALVFYFRKMVAFETAQRRYAKDLQNERDELETQVRRRTGELTELASHLQTVREDERSRLARELHDELGALLTAAKLDVARLKRGVGETTPDMEQRIRHLNNTIDQGISLKRRIIEDLRPSSLSNLGLVVALEIQAREFGTRANLRVHTQLEHVVLPEAAQITVYRLVQESFTNIAKYATATEVTLSLQADGERVRVAVEDNGCGFDSARLSGISHGLTGMRYRVEASGGELSVVSATGRGTMIEAWLPRTGTTLRAS